MMMMMMYTTPTMKWDWSLYFCSIKQTIGSSHELDNHQILTMWLVYLPESVCRNTSEQVRNIDANELSHLSLLANLTNILELTRILDMLMQ